MHFHQELILASETLTNYCLFTLFMSQDIVIIWTVKFGKPPPVIHQFCHGFPFQKFALYGICMHTTYVCICVWLLSRPLITSIDIIWASHG